MIASLLNRPHYYRESSVEVLAMKRNSTCLLYACLFLFCALLCSRLALSGRYRSVACCA